MENGIKLGKRGPQKCDKKKDDPQVWATYPLLTTLTEREKNLNTKPVIT